MSMMMDMMQSMPKNDVGMDMTMMQECIEACSAAAQAATMCADACAGMDGMGRCASMDANVADVATTTMRMMMRPAGYDMDSMRSMLTACIAMGSVSAKECRMHADTQDHCRICAMASEAMVTACERAMSSMASMK
ncbi:MAG: aldehyde dehydrogenase [Microbacteriaceae bacterium]|nr:aldehyde dehydrogenase [Microbacteriaceae bacterium]